MGILGERDHTHCKKGISRPLQVGIFEPSHVILDVRFALRTWRNWLPIFVSWLVITWVLMMMSWIFSYNLPNFSLAVCHYSLCDRISVAQFATLALHGTCIEFKATQGVIDLYLHCICERRKSLQFLKTNFFVMKSYSPTARYFFFVNRGSAVCNSKPRRLVK